MALKIKGSAMKNLENVDAILAGQAVSAKLPKITAY